jgi:DNA-binding GntR family transcriptional regulator
MPKPTNATARRPKSIAPASEKTPLLADSTLESLPDSEAEMYRSISGTLLDGKLRPGTPLRERTLAEVFGVTRGAVRKVLARLEREGKVELHQNRGAFVPHPSVEDIHTVYDARRAVEGGILALLSGRLSAAQLRELNAHVKSEEAAHLAGDREESIRLAGAFHARLTRMTHNLELEAFLQRLLARTQLFVALYESHTHMSCAPEEHRTIVEALARGATTEAIAEMLAHLDKIEARVTQRIMRDESSDLAEIFNRYRG